MHIDAANAFAVRSIDNHIYRAHKKSKKKKNKKNSFEENLRKYLYERCFRLVVVAARLPVVTQLDPKFRLYLPCRQAIAMDGLELGRGVAESKRQMKFHCKQTRYGKLSSLNKFPLSWSLRLDNSPESAHTSIRILLWGNLLASFCLSLERLSGKHVFYPNWSLE